MLADDLTQEQKDAARNTGMSYSQVKAQAQASAPSITSSAAVTKNQVSTSKEGVTSYYTPLSSEDKTIRQQEYEKRSAMGDVEGLKTSQSTQTVKAYQDRNKNKNNKPITSVPVMPLLAADGTPIKQIEFGKGNSHILGIRGVAMQVNADGEVTNKKAISDKDREKAYQDRLSSGKPNKKTNAEWKAKIENTAKSIVTSDSVLKADKIEKYAAMPITSGTNAIDRRRINLARNVIYASLPTNQQQTYYDQMKAFDKSANTYKAETGFSNKKINKKRRKS